MTSTSRTAAARAQAEEMVIRAASARGMTAGEAVTSDSLEQAAAPIIEAVEAKLTQQTQKFTKHAQDMARGNGRKPDADALADPFTTSPFVPLYNWWDMVLYGPFQPITPGASGPFLPNKIIRAGEPAFMVCAIWRNPAPIGWALAGPSASVVMSAFNMSVTLETVDLTDVADGPDFGPINLAPMGPGPINVFTVPLTFPAPPDGKPHLYEINMTADVNGPVAGLPFAGYSTWTYDPDYEPAFLYLPAIPPQLQHDIPARVLVYTA